MAPMVLKEKVDWGHREGDVSTSPYGLAGLAQREGITWNPAALQDLKQVSNELGRLLHLGERAWGEPIAARHFGHAVHRSFDYDDVFRAGRLVGIDNADRQVLDRANVGKPSPL